MSLKLCLIKSVGNSNNLITITMIHKDNCQKASEWIFKVATSLYWHYQSKWDVITGSCVSAEGCHRFNLHTCFLCTQSKLMVGSCLLQSDSENFVWVTTTQAHNCYSLICPWLPSICHLVSYYVTPNLYKFEWKHNLNVYFNPYLLLS